MLHLETLVTGAYEENCYLAWLDPAAAMVIDPGADAAHITAACARLGLRVGRYLLTHGHYDHLGALPALARAHPAPIGVHPLDGEWAFSVMNQNPPYYPATSRAGLELFDLADGQVVACGGLSLQVIATPGHSPGCVCLHAPEHLTLFTGDTLFAGSAGRTDLPGGDSRALAASLRRLADLPDATRVYPGHGPATDLGTEKESNFFMQSAARGRR